MRERGVTGKGKERGNVANEPRSSGSYTARLIFIVYVSKDSQKVRSEASANARDGRGEACDAALTEGDANTIRIVFLGPACVW